MGKQLTYLLLLCSILTFGCTRHKDYPHAILQAESCMDEQNLYIRSSVELTNLDVCIRDTYGNIVYSSTLAIQAGRTAMIPVALSMKGNIPYSLMKEVSM